MRTLRWAATAASSYDALPQEQRRWVDQTLWAIATVPQLGSPLHGPLKGMRSAHVRGALRVVYVIESGRDMLSIVAVAHRRDVYR